MNQREALQSITAIIREHLNEAYKVFLFGSRAQRTAGVKSDYDIGIEGPDEVKLPVLAKIQDAVAKLSIFQSVDIVDFKSVEKAFYTTATKKRQWIN